MFLLKIKFILFFCLFAGILMINSCKDKKDSVPQPIYNNSAITLSKSTGVEKMSLTITGGPFSTTMTDNSVTFNGVAAVVTSATSTSITVNIPISTTGPVKVVVNGTTAPTQPIFTYIDMTCADFDKLQYSNFSITSTTSNTINYEMDLKNTGTKPLNLVRCSIQNYVSSNNTFEASDAAAGGFSMFIVTGADFILEPGQTIHITHHANNLSGNYLIVELKAYVANYANCNGSEQYIIVAK